MSYRRALSLAGDVARRAPQDAEAVRPLALVHEKMADVQAWTGDVQEAAKSAETALTLFRGLAVQHPGDLRHQFSLAISLVKTGDLLGNPSFPNLGKRQEAVASYREARGILDDLAVAHPEDLGVRRYRGLVRERLGTVLLATGDAEAATAAYRDSFEIRQSYAADFPGNAEAQRDVAVALEKLGDVLLESGDPRQALGELQRSFEIFRSLAEADPENASAQRSLAISHQKLAVAFERLGRLENAGEELRASREILEELASRDPGNTQLQEELAALADRLEAFPAAAD